MKPISASSIVATLLILLCVLLTGCDPGPYGNSGYPYPPQPGYSTGYGYPPPPPPNYGGSYYPPPPPPPRRYDDRYYDDRRYEDRDRYHNHHDHDDNHHANPSSPSPSSSVPTAAAIRPSCPSGTTFDGHHCLIDDKSKIRKGGKGTVNACPKGMRLSGDQCIPN